MAANPSAKNGQQTSPNLPPPPKLLEQVRTTIRLNRGGLAINSPLDRL